MANFNFQGVALVTGAGSGIGREVCLSFARSGALGIVFADINVEAARAVAKEGESVAIHQDFRALVIGVDVVDEDAVVRMVEATVQAFGRIDYLINSAGVGSKSANHIKDLDFAELQNTYDINVKGTLHCMKYVIRIMEKQDFQTAAGRARSGKREIGRGVIVNLSSISGVVALPGMTPYVSSKFGVRALTKVAALECGPLGIRVNCVAPFGVDSPIMDRSFARMPGWREVLEKRSPLGRLCEMDEVADTVLFLSSPLSSYINGQALVVDGGIACTAQSE